MFKKNDDGTVGNDVLTILDFQMPKVGTGMNDLARFLVSSVPSKIFREKLGELLGLYYDTVRDYLREHNKKMPYNFEKVWIVLLT